MFYALLCITGAFCTSTQVLLATADTGLAGQVLTGAAPWGGTMGLFWEFGVGETGETPSSDPTIRLAPQLIHNFSPVSDTKHVLHDVM